MWRKILSLDFPTLADILQKYPVLESNARGGASDIMKQKLGVAVDGALASLAKLCCLQVGDRPTDFIQQLSDGILVLTMSNPLFAEKASRLRKMHGDCKKMLAKAASANAQAEFLATLSAVKAISIKDTEAIMELNTKVHVFASASRLPSEDASTKVVVDFGLKVTKAIFAEVSSEDASVRGCISDDVLQMLQKLVVLLPRDEGDDLRKGVGLIEAWIELANAYEKWVALGEDSKARVTNDQPFNKVGAALASSRKVVEDHFGGDEQPVRVQALELVGRLGTGPTPGDGKF